MYQIPMHEILFLNSLMIRTYRGAFNSHSMHSGINRYSLVDVADLVIEKLSKMDSADFFYARLT